MSRTEAYLESKGIDFSSSGSEAPIVECPFCHGHDDLSVNISGDHQDGLFICFKCGRKVPFLCLVMFLGYGNQRYSLRCVPLMDKPGRSSTHPVPQV